MAKAKGNPNWKKGQPKKGGRTKGTPNKFTDLKRAFLDAFEKIEKESGKKDSKIDGLFKWATKNSRNQGLFYQMIARMLPSNISGDFEGQLEVILRKTYTDERPEE